MKQQELNVKENTLKLYGAVSIEVINEMLDGVIKKFNADFAIAGPTGAIKNKPIGTVVIGIIGEYKKKK